MLRKVFAYGLIAGCSMSLVLYALMYTIHPPTRLGEIVWKVGIALWPTSLSLMAVQSPGNSIFAVSVFATAVLSNGLLYGLLAVGGWLVARRLGRV